MSHKSTRLGDLLVEQRTISALQLREAIELQEVRRLNRRSSTTNTNENYELGEILIELGFISRHQLTTSLSWQRSLRKATTVMVFIAPLLTAACGGGAAATSGNSNAQSNNVSSQTLSTQEPATTLSSAAKSSAAKSSSLKSSAASSAKEVVITPPASAAASSTPSSKTVSSSKASSKSSVPVASSSKPAASSLASSSVKSGVVDGPVQLYWDIPKEREDGARLDVTEISGYEVRYKLKSDAGFQSVNIADGYTDAYYFTYLQGDYEFQIATYDKNGLYSAFVSVSPY